MVSASAPAIPNPGEPHESFTKKVWRLTYPYWQSEEKWSARGLLFLIVALNLGMVYLNVLFNTWNNDFYNSLQKYNQPEFWRQLTRFCYLAAFFITVAVYRIYVTQQLEMRWRRWLTKRYLDDWLNNRVYYRMELTNTGTDNPDQRIAEDLKLYTDGTLTLSVGLLNAVVSLIAFMGILWSVSGPLSFTIGGTSWTIQGYMVWAAVIYAIAGSYLTHHIGKPLIGLIFSQQRFEANFRFGLIRLRENAEGVALYGGEPSEKQALLGHFSHILSNWWSFIKASKRLNSFVVGYQQVAVIFPFFVAAPRYFNKTIELGGLMQIANAFGEVRQALSWFVESYGSIAPWKASVDRLLGFSSIMDQAVTAQQHGDRIVVESGDAITLTARDLEIGLPNNQTILKDGELTIQQGEKILLTGASGSGKSTLFRAIAGIWPFGRGRVRRPSGKRTLFLPQKPYLPIGPLRDSVCYPGKPGEFPDAAIVEALSACKLEGLITRLDESANWAQKLSPGEQQRLAFARALLHKPDWLFMDEATSALDEATEQEMYRLLSERLAHSTVISIAHRPSVGAFHTRKLTLSQSADGTMQLQPA